MNRQVWVRAMSEHFGEDERRINHALKVLRYAEEIMDGEKVSDEVRNVATAAAVFHDIGIREAERKHGSSSGGFQEIEGPPIARRLLAGLSEGDKFIERVCYIVGNHHSADKINGLDFQILWDADLVVNIEEEGLRGGREKLEAIIEKSFKTKTGRAVADKLYPLPSDLSEGSLGDPVL